jgi:hypothetical protein
VDEGAAAARQLDNLAGFIATPITARRGHAREAAHEAGLAVTDRTLKAWLDGKRNPSQKNLPRRLGSRRTSGGPGHQRRHRRQG